MEGKTLLFWTFAYGGITKMYFGENKMKNFTAKSKKLIDKQFESLGIATDNSLGSANIGTALSTGFKAIGTWAQSNPEAVLAIADA